MENDVKVHIRCDQKWCLHLSLECPLCGAQQEFPIATASSGEEFVCECGEDVRVTAASMHPVRRELEEIKHLIEKTIVLPI
jgi:RNase P subunit RPR2